MTTPNCKNCDFSTEVRSKVVRHGRYYRTSDSSWIQRFRCLSCRAGFSRATFHPCYRQKKRHKNRALWELLSSGMSQRRAARFLRLNRITIVRKFLYLSIESEFRLRVGNLAKPKAEVVEFDDLETFEHTKCKPLSITLAVESGTRRILGVEVSRMNANGPLAKKSVKKYGSRIDDRRRGRMRLFSRIKDLMEQDSVIKSDSNPHYAKDVKRAFPKAFHKLYLGKRGSLGGQGELKKVRFDPLFSLNHTCGMLRANINRLFRKTWNTTKRQDRLYAHLVIYAAYHNEYLPAQETTN